MTNQNIIDQTNKLYTLLLYRRTKQYGYGHSIFRNNKLINLTLHDTRL